MAKQSRVKTNQRKWYSTKRITKTTQTQKIQGSITDEEVAVRKKEFGQKFGQQTVRCDGSVHTVTKASDNHTSESHVTGIYIPMFSHTL